MRRGISRANTGTSANAARHHFADFVLVAHTLWTHITAIYISLHLIIFKFPRLVRPRLLYADDLGGRTFKCSVTFVTHDRRSDHSSLTFALLRPHCQPASAAGRLAPGFCNVNSEHVSSRTTYSMSCSAILNSLTDKKGALDTVSAIPEKSSPSLPAKFKPRSRRRFKPRILI